MNKIPKENYFDLVIFCNDYHSGQWSRGYRILSRFMKLGVSWGSGLEKEIREGFMYNYLVENYADKI